MDRRAERRQYLVRRGDLHLVCIVGGQLEAVDVLRLFEPFDREFPEVLSAPVRLRTDAMPRIRPAGRKPR
jgi:hypothetical protein